MSRPPTPTAILDARGAFLNHPDRERDAEPQPEGDLPIEPPDFLRLTPKMKEIWRELVSMLAPGVGKSTDVWGIESLVRLKAKERSGRITSSERGQLIALYGRFALTASDRSKVSVEKPKQSKLASFLNKPKPAPVPAPEMPAPANTLPA